MILLGPKYWLHSWDISLRGVGVLGSKVDVYAKSMQQQSKAFEEALCRIAISTHAQKKAKIDAIMFGSNVMLLQHFIVGGEQSSEQRRVGRLGNTNDFVEDLHISVAMN